MNSNIKKIIEKVDHLNEKLSKEYTSLAKKYGFSIKKRKVLFLKKFKEKNKRFRIPTIKYVLPKNIRHLLSIPFIYAMIIPLIIMDIFITLYHWVAFPLYRIPRVKRQDYINYDRKYLNYLNSIQKVNCLYCSYANGFIAYAQEIAARTERYWCPLKAAKRPKFHHEWYKDFADYGNPKEWNKKFIDAKAFDEVRKKEYKKTSSKTKKKTI